MVTAVNFDHVRTKPATHISKVVSSTKRGKRINRNLASTILFIYALLLLLSYLILQITVVDVKSIFAKRFICHPALGLAQTHAPVPVHIRTVLCSSGHNKRTQGRGSISCITSNKNCRHRAPLCHPRVRQHSSVT